MTIKEVGSLKAKSIPNCETNQCHGFSIEVFRFYDNPSCVSCFFVGTWPCVTIPRRVHDPLPPIEVNGKHEYEMEDVLDSKISNCQFQYFVINMGMMWASALGNLSITYQMPWRRCINFINNIQTSPSPFLVKFVVRKGGDVTDANAMEFIHLNVHPWLVINLYLTFNLVSNFSSTIFRF